MTTLSEGDLRLMLPEPVTGRKFDGAQHDLSHCMKAVDWILELPDRIYFIEVTDPDDPRAREHRERVRFLQSFRSDKRTKEATRFIKNLVVKFRDSFLYEWACNRVDKPISYYVIVASDTLDAALLVTRTDDLKCELPAKLHAGWTRVIAHGCCIFNVASWNNAFPECPLVRISDAGLQPPGKHQRSDGRSTAHDALSHGTAFSP